MDRKNIAAFTEEGVEYPAYLSVNREPDGTCSVTVRERGHGGAKTAQITGLSPNQVHIFAAEMLDGLGPDF